ncbi:MAG: hypothetical protein QOF01_5394 [Thermomicrobiales bacterium]|jgi:hypothetical protein|nr:hypothetical protein [Thermomicrobiales bacterium]
MIITMCRNLYLFRNHTVASKREAAAWAAQLLPEWSSLIRNALVWREATDDELADQDATLPETSRFVHFVIETILVEQASPITP